MKRLLIAALLPICLNAKSTRSTTRKAQQNITALRTSTHRIPGIIEEEYDAIMQSVQHALYDLDEALDTQLPSSLRIALHKQLSFYQQLSPAYLRSLDRVDAAQLQTQLDALTDELTAKVAQDTHSSLPLNTLAHIRLANSYLYTLLNPRHFKQASGWKKLTRGGGGSHTVVAPILGLVAGTVLATGACFLYTIKNGPGDFRYFLRRQCRDDATLAAQHDRLHRVAQSLEAVEGGIMGADFMARKAEAGLVAEVGTDAREITRQHLGRLLRCLEHDVVLAKATLAAADADIEKQVKERGTASESCIRCPYEGHEQLCLKRDVKNGQKAVNALRDLNDLMPLNELMNAIGTAHTASINPGLANNRVSTFAQVQDILTKHYDTKRAELPVRASYIYNKMVYKLLAGTPHFTGYIEQARLFIAGLPEEKHDDAGVQTIQTYIRAYDAHEPAITECALIALHQFVTETGPALVRAS